MSSSYACYAKLSYWGFFQPRTSKPMTQHPSVCGKQWCANNEKNRWLLVLVWVIMEKSSAIIIFQPGDCPCQFFCHQIIYQCVRKFISHQQPHQDNCGNPQATSDHSAYSFPSFIGSDNEQSLQLNLFSQPSILSVIPIIDSLHLSLNSREHIVTSFHPFFKTVYERIFTWWKRQTNENPKDQLALRNF